MASGADAVKDGAPAEEGAPGAPAAPGPLHEAAALGDAKADPVTVDENVEELARKYMAGDTGANPVKVNLSRIGSGQDIGEALAHISTHIPDNGVLSHDATVAQAMAMGLRPEEFMQAYPDTTLGASRVYAMRMMLDSSASQLLEHAAAVTDPTQATPEAQARFLRAMATHQAIQTYYEGARADVGRSLNAFGIMSRTNGDQMQAINDLIANFGGSGDLTKLANRIVDLKDPDKVNPFVAKARHMTPQDLFLHGFYNTILSGVPHVLAKKLTSDGLSGLWEMAVRATAARMPGSSGAVAAGEAAQMAYGYSSAFRDALRLAGRGIATGEKQFGGDRTIDGTWGSRLQMAAMGAPEAITPDTPTRGAMDYLKMALPTRWLGAADDFANYMHYRAFLNANAFREGTKRGLSGDALEQHVAQATAQPSDALHQQSKDEARRAAFQDPLTGVAASLSKAADQMQIPLPRTEAKIPIGRMILPFVKIPANMMAWVYRQSPLSAAFPSEEIKNDLAAGGARRDMVIARQTLGSGLALAMGGLAMGGRLTGRGPSDPGLNRAWRAAGNQPYSLRIGDTWHSFDQVDPLGLYMGAIADTHDILKFSQNDNDRYNVAASLGFGLGHALLNKTYMSGLAKLFDAFQTPEREGTRYLQNFAASLTPGALKGIDDAADPWLRAHDTLLQAVAARTPGLSENLPPLRTLWGDPMRKSDGFLPPLSGTGIARAVSPIKDMPADQGQPIDRWIWNHRNDFQEADRGTLSFEKPGPAQSFSVGTINVPLRLNPRQLDDFIVQAGNGLKGTHGLGARDTLNALVTGRYPGDDEQAAWDRATPAVQAIMVRTMINKFREGAKHELLARNPDLADAVQSGAAARAQQLRGAAQ